MIEFPSLSIAEQARKEVRDGTAKPLSVMFSLSCVMAEDVDFSADSKAGKVLKCSQRR